MDQVEKWLVEQAEHFDGYEKTAVLEVASKWHEEGAAVLAQQEGWEGDLDEMRGSRLVELSEDAGLYEKTATPIHTRGPRQGQPIEQP